MLFSKVDKKTLIDLLLIRNPNETYRFEEMRQLPPLKDDELLLVWKKDTPNQYFPIYICTSRGKSKEFLAWAATYLKQLRPFSTFIRVVDVDEFDIIRYIHSSNLSFGFKNALVGLVIGEILDNQKLAKIKHLNPMAAKSTLSSVIAKLIINNLPYNKSEIIRMYGTALNLAGVPNSISYVMGVWMNLLPILNKEIKFDDAYYNKLFYFPICDALDYIAKGKKITNTLLGDVLRQPINLPDISIMEDKIESRVESFERACNIILSNRQVHPQSASFAIACLANQISPGTMRHHTLLEPYSRSLPGIFSWYGVCAGLTLNSDILSYDYGFGWRVLRQLLTPIDLFNYPDSDICFSEYEMILKSESPDLTFNTESGTDISIELLPGITIYIPWPPRSNQRDNVYTHIEQASLFDPNPEYASLEMLGKKLNDALDLYNKLLKQKTIGNDKKNSPRKSRQK